MIKTIFRCEECGEEIVERNDGMVFGHDPECSKYPEKNGRLTFTESRYILMNNDSSSKTSFGAWHDDGHRTKKKYLSVVLCGMD